MSDVTQSTDKPILELIEGLAMKHEIESNKDSKSDKRIILALTLTEENAAKARQMFADGKMKHLGIISMKEITSDSHQQTPESQEGWLDSELRKRNSEIDDETRDLS